MYTYGTMEEMVHEIQNKQKIQANNDIDLYDLRLIE